MADDTGADKDFLEYVIRSIVSDPNAVQVTRTVDDKGVLLTLQVGKDDMGKVIGKGGQTAKSVRILLRVIGAKSDLRVNMKIVEPEGGTVMEPTDGSSEEQGEASADGSSDDLGEKSAEAESTVDSGEELPS